jgi:acetyl esterase
MTIWIGRRALLQSGAAMLGGVMMSGISSAQAKDPGAKTSYEFMVKDLVYHHSGSTARLARLYQPAGTGPFPAVLQVHGGAWNNKDRTDGQNTALDLAAAGIVVVSIDFRNAPEAPYPASLQDINYGIRWLKAHAREFGSSADRVGAYGTSSGGHHTSGENG